MRLFQMAVESEEEVIVDETAPKEEVAEVVDAAEPEIVEADAELVDVISDLESSEEGENILETTETMAETIDKKVEDGEGIDEVATEVVVPALEHFYTRVGFNSTKSHGLSLESFKKKETRLDSTKIILEELHEFNRKLGNGLAIAQEGIFARIGNTVKLMFTSQEKIEAKIIAATEAADGKDTSIDLIEEPGWGRSFAVIGKTKLMPSDVISYVERYKKIMLSPDFAGIVTEYVKIMNQVLAEISKSTFFSRDESATVLKGLIEKVDTFKAKSDSLLFNSNLKTTKTNPSFAPLDKSSLKKLSTDALVLISDAKINKLIRDVKETTAAADKVIWREGQSRLKLGLAKDIQAAKLFTQHMNPAMREIFAVMAQRNRICFACANYIKASIKK